MDRDTLRQKITAAFSQTPYPGDDHIAYHQCEECDEIRRDFRGKIWTALDPIFIKGYHHVLPLLSSVAFHHFLPAYMICSLDGIYSDVTEYLLYSLSPDNIEHEFWQQRLRVFTPFQKETIVTFLEFVKQEDLKGEFAKEVDLGLQIWKGHASVVSRKS